MADEGSVSSYTSIASDESGPDVNVRPASPDYDNADPIGLLRGMRETWWCIQQPNLLTHFPHDPDCEACSLATVKGRRDVRTYGAHRKESTSFGDALDLKFCSAGELKVDTVGDRPKVY